MSACPNPAAQIVWRELYQRARQAQRPRVLSPFAEAGGVGAALLAAACAAMYVYLGRGGARRFEAL